MKNDYKILKIIYYNRIEKFKEKIYNFNIKNENLKFKFRIINDINFNDLNRKKKIRRFFRIVVL